VHCAGRRRLPDDDEVDEALVEYSVDVTRVTRREIHGRAIVTRCCSPCSPMDFVDVLLMLQ